MFNPAQGCHVIVEQVVLVFENNQAEVMEMWNKNVICLNLLRLNQELLLVLIRN